MTLVFFYLKFIFMWLGFLKLDDVLKYTDLDFEDVVIIWVKSCDNVLVYH